MKYEPQRIQSQGREIEVPGQNGRYEKEPRKSPRRKGAEKRRKPEDQVSHEELTRRLSYDPETGIFTWLVPNHSRQEIGSIAGCVTSRKYIYITVDQVIYYAHRLAWFYVHKEWPKDLIDHINGDKTDNRISNLRQADSHQNAWNTKRNRRNTSGERNVAYSKARGAWLADFRSGGERHFLGAFPSKEAAVQAAISKRNELRGEFARH